MAKYKKKRARELKHDRFRDATMSFFDRLGDLMEGRGRTILYGLGGLLVAGLIVLLFVKWSNRKSDEARQAYQQIQDTLRREVMEETGVPLRSVRYHSSQPWPFPASDRAPALS